MRKPGVVAGAALIALEKMRHLVGKDNEIAKIFSKRLVELGWFSIAIKVETNLLYFRITD